MEKREAPLVSVIMPSYNAERFIDAAIASVVEQSMENWELIIIDDGSCDRSVALAKAWQEKDGRICVLQNEKNSGVAKTRNRGIELAKGQYIAFLDSDDVWHREKLQRQLERMAEENAQIGYCSYAIIGADGEQARPDYLVPDSARLEDILKENFIQCSAMLIRADLVKRILFNTEFYHEDYILGLDMLKEGNKAAGCTQVLLSWRYVQNSRSFNKWKSARNRWRIYRRYLKLSFWKSLYYQICYTFAGLRKYFL